MNVSIIQHTSLLSVISACRVCYNSECKSDSTDNYIGESDRLLIKKILESNHTSVLEHFVVSFGIEGISRACSHQLVRHRLASYSQQSQRYVKAGSMPDVVVPDSVNTMETRGIYNQAMAMSWAAYQVLIDAGIPAEDARYVLPNAATTSLVMTMNARELRHFFRLRCCNRAQWEIREMADRMLNLCQEAAPVLFEGAGAACVSGKCSEGKMSCGNPKGKG